MKTSAWIPVLLVVIAVLQHKLWLSDVGKLSEANLAAELETQSVQYQALQARNEDLTAEVVALKASPDALESRARRDLGMVKAGEVFYFVPEVP